MLEHGSRKTNPRHHRTGLKNCTMGSAFPGPLKSSVSSCVFLVSAATLMLLLLACPSFVNGRPGPAPDIGTAVSSLAHSAIIRLLQETAKQIAMQKPAAVMDAVAKQPPYFMDLAGAMQGPLGGRSAIATGAGSDQEELSSTSVNGTERASENFSQELDGSLLMSKPPIPIKPEDHHQQNANATASASIDVDKVSSAAFREFLELLLEKLDTGKNVSTAAVEASAELQLDDEDLLVPKSKPPNSVTSLRNNDELEEGSASKIDSRSSSSAGGIMVNPHQLEKDKKKGDDEEEPSLSGTKPRTPVEKSDDLGSVLGFPKHLSATHFQPLNSTMTRQTRKVGEDDERDSKLDTTASGRKEDLDEKYARNLAAAINKGSGSSPGTICGGKHDNCVTDVKVVCEAQSVTVMVQFARPFLGLVRLGNQLSDCVVYRPEQSPQQTLIVTIAADTCPTATKYRSQDFVTAERHRVQVQFDAETSTYEDVNFLAQCAPGENYAKQLEMRYTVLDSAPVKDMLQRITGKSSFEVAILQGFSAYSTPLSGEVQIGTPLTVSLKVKAPNAKHLDLKILSCWASFGEPSQKFSSWKRTYMANNKRMGEPLLEVVRNGCSVRPTVFGNFVRLNPPLPQPSVSAAVPEKGATKTFYDDYMVFHAPFRAFRFAESDTVRLQCKVVVCYGKCPGNDRPCPQTSVERSYDLTSQGRPGKKSAPEDGAGGTSTNQGSPTDGQAAAAEKVSYYDLYKVRLSARASSLEDALLQKHAESAQHATVNSMGSSAPTADLPDRLKRGTAILHAGLISFVGEEHRGGAGANEIAGFFTSGSTMIDFGKAVVWAKCALPDQVAVTLNDPSGFTGDIIVEQALNAMPPPWPQTNHPHPSGLDDNRVKRQGQVPYPLIMREAMPVPIAMKHRRYQQQGQPEIQQPPCSANSRETFYNAYEATVLRKMDCMNHGRFGNKYMDMKFIIKINSASGLSKVATLDCRRKFFVLE